jgi:hypothetical protein|tara:strand:+ start:8458 stop:8919 length:462 start_codon:yes stop_codon:yes gene_type:complete
MIIDIVPEQILDAHVANRVFARPPTPALALLRGNKLILGQLLHACHTSDESPKRRGHLLFLTEGFWSLLECFSELHLPQLHLLCDDLVLIDDQSFRVFPPVAAFCFFLAYVGHGRLALFARFRISGVFQVELESEYPVVALSRRACELVVVDL